MYKISVPIKNDIVNKVGKERLRNEVRRFGAERIFLSLGTYELDPKRQKEAFCQLQENCRYFKEQGFEVGAWLWTFWVKGNSRFSCMRSINGSEISESACPHPRSPSPLYAVQERKRLTQCGTLELFCRPGCFPGNNSFFGLQGDLCRWM